MDEQCGESIEEEVMGEGKGESEMEELVPDYRLHENGQREKQKIIQ